MRTLLLRNGFIMRAWGLIASVMAGRESLKVQIKEWDVNVISMVSASFMLEGKRIAAIRIRTEDYEPIVKDLDKARYPVLSTSKWPSV